MIRKSLKSKPCPSKGKKRKRMPRKFQTEWGVRYPDGREVCDKRTAAGRSEYGDRKIQMWYRDGGRCCICGRFVESFDAEYEHKLGRGMNGSHRDDRIEGNGIAHHGCNMEKGSRRSSKLGRMGSGE